MRTSSDRPGLAPEELASFHKHRTDRNVLAVRVGIVITLLIQIPFGVFEWIAIRDHFVLLQWLRLAWVVPAVFILVKLRTDEGWAQRHVDLITFALYVGSAAFIVTASFLHTGYASPYSYVLVMMLVGVGFVTLWPLSIALAFYALVYALYLLPIVAGFGQVKDMANFVGYQMFLIGIGAVILVSQRLRMRLEQRSFLGNLRLRQTKASLQATYERLKEIDQLKSDFFANVSHELRTPLTLSLGPLESLLQSPRPEDQANLLTVYRNQQRLSRLINQLLDLAKFDSGLTKSHFVRTDAAQLVHLVMEQVRGAATAKGLELRFERARGELEVYVDRDKLEQVLLNLLSNAFKFTEPADRITVSLERRGDEARISVADTGIGIAEDKLGTIFDRFAQADSSTTRKYAGTGIGLSLVRAHVELHGGRVLVESRLGEGSTFIVCLPLGKDHLPAAEIVPDSETQPLASRLAAHDLVEFQVDPATEDERWPSTWPAIAEEQAEDIVDWVAHGLDASGQRPRVLVVDDTPDMRRYLQSLLERYYEVRTAVDGADGLRKARAWCPDLIVSDIMMPVMSGSELCKAIKSEPGPVSRTPIVLVTARTEEQTKLQNLEHGADDYLLKPFLQQELILRARNLIVKHRQERALHAAHVRLRAQQDYLQSDMELARDFQKGLLPQLDLGDGLQAHVEFHPADIVGGDFYCLTKIADNQTRLLLADMADHGVKAAVRAAAALPEYTALPHNTLDPAEALAALNEVACRKYVDLSGSFLCMDIETRPDGRVSLHYAHAGEMPIVLICEGEVANVPAASGFVVGLFPQMSYTARKLVVGAGSRLFLQSDGLCTQLNDQGQAFATSEALAEAWRSASKQADIEAATTIVMDALRTFRGRTAQVDDVTVIGIEVGKSGVVS